jgi:hypothetical protein
MAFKIKAKPKRRKIPKPEYFKEREVRDLGKHASFQAMARVGTRRSLGVPERIYKEGNVVEYKGNLAVVEKVSKKGIHIRVYKRDKDGFASAKSKKTKFLSVKDVEKGKTYPYFIDLPDFVIGYGSFGKR